MSLPSTPGVTIVAPHPDDEVLGVGGLLRELVCRGTRLRLVAVTDGEAAFGTTPPAERAALVARRIQERQHAVSLLGVTKRTEIVRLQLPDAAVSAHEETLADCLTNLIGHVVLARWRHDGHPDHEAVGRAAAQAAARRSARLLEYPVWAPRNELSRWLPVRLLSHRLSDPTRAAKIAAVHAFHSQLDPSPDGRPVVPRQLVDQVCSSDEVLIA